jgi:outer membrane protein TolC
MKERELGSLLPKRNWTIRIGSFVGLSLIFCCLLAGQNQGPQYPNAPSASQPQGTSGGSFSNQGAFSGSVPQGEVSSEALPLTFKDAIDLGLKNNLGLLLQSDNTIAARGQKWKELSELLPNLSAEVTENVAQDNLAARGLRFPGFPTIVGPYGFFDARVYLKQTVFDFSDLERLRAAKVNEEVAKYNYKDARDLVVLAVGNAYLLALAGAARVETAEAQVQTGQALYDKAADQLKAGVSPAIDSLREKVELQSRQQQAIVARNNFAKQKLALIRAIGLPVGQQITLTDKAPYEPLAAWDLDTSLKRAYLTRSDYLAAAQQVRASELLRKSATAEHLPSAFLSANYGDLGITPGQSHGTFAVSGGIHIPIFAGGKAHADALQYEAQLKQSQQQLDNLRAQIEYEVRVALLDLNAAAEQVEVARSSVDLANQTMTQARDRFTAGVADNLEVVQAQEAVAAANESYISSLYAHNLAKVELARAVGFAEEGVRQYLQSH